MNAKTTQSIHIRFPSLDQSGSPNLEISLRKLSYGEASLQILSQQLGEYLVVPSAIERRIDRFSLVESFAPIGFNQLWAFTKENGREHFLNLAFALALRNAGVAIDHLYLAAAALDMGICAIGSGDSLDYTGALGISQWEQPVVATLLVGDKPA